MNQDKDGSELFFLDTYALYELAQAMMAIRITLLMLNL